MSDFYVVAELEEWPGPRTEQPRSSSFRSFWQQTEDLLETELAAIGAYRVVLQLDITPRDLRRDGTLRTDARPGYHGAILSFESEEGSMQFAVDAFDHWQDNVRAIALGLEALRKLNRYGIAPRHEQYRGWKKLPSVSDSYTAATEILAAYGGEKEAVKRAHPDHGGSPEEWAKVQWARSIVHGSQEEEQ